MALGQGHSPPPQPRFMQMGKRDVLSRTQANLTGKHAQAHLFCPYFPSLLQSLMLEALMAGNFGLLLEITNPGSKELLLIEADQHVSILFNLFIFARILWNLTILEGKYQIAFFYFGRLFRQRRGL